MMSHTDPDFENKKTLTGGNFYFENNHKKSSRYCL
jgi:hypothetical protein